VPRIAASFAANPGLTVRDEANTIVLQPRPAPRDRGCATPEGGGPERLKHLIMKERGRPTVLRPRPGYTPAAVMMASVANPASKPRSRP
jgi:hypothetical protein